MENWDERWSIDLKNRLIPVKKGLELIILSDLVDGKRIALVGLNEVEKEEHFEDQTQRKENKEVLMKKNHNLHLF